MDLISPSAPPTSLYADLTLLNYCGIIKKVMVMALIKCSECGKEISNKSLACIYCGCPLDNVDIEKSEVRYDVILVKLANNCNKLKLIGHIRGATGLGLSEVKQKIDNLPQIIFKNMEYDSAKSAHNSLMDFGGLPEIIESKSINGYSKENDVFRNFNEKTIICPHCGSVAVTTGQRGFSILTGFLGSNKTVNRCGKCGWSWKP